MSKVTLTNLTDLTNEISAVTNINNNSATIVTAFDNTLSRDGTSPNQMNADIDLNSHDLLNVATVNTTNLVVGGENLNSSVQTAVNAATSATASETAAANSASQAATSASNASASAAQITLPLPVSSGGTGVTTSTGSGSTVLSASPTFTGIPLAPTAATGTNTNQLATTAFVIANSAANGIAVVASRTALASLPQLGSAFVEGPTGGIFEWTSGNFSTQVTSDPAQGIYVPPSTDTTGASGAWVRLTVPGFYWGAWFGVVGDGTDQTTAFSNMLSTIPTSGGVVFLGGSITVTSINLNARRNIIFYGSSGIGAGATESTTITYGSTGATRVIDMRTSSGVQWFNIYFNQTNSAFTGILVDLNDTTSGTSYARFENCTISTSGACISHYMYGATEWQFVNCNFIGKGRVQLQNASGVGFCNVGKFDTCSFHPSGSQYPISGSGEAIAWVSCTFQADSTDGIGRAYQSNTSQACKSLSFIGNGFFDVTTVGGEWLQVSACDGFTFMGNEMGGADPAGGGNYGIALGGALTGVRGIAIGGNEFSYMTAAFTFSGTGTTGAQDGWIGGNVVSGSTSLLVSSFSSTTRVMLLPNLTVGANDQGAHLNVGYGFPTASTGLQTGDIYANSNVLTKV